MQISQKGLMARGNFTKNGTNLRPGEFFFGFDPFRPLCPHIIQCEPYLGLSEKLQSMHSVQFVKYDVTVSFMAQVLDTVTYLVPQVLDTAS